MPPVAVGVFATLLSLIAIGVPSLWGDEVATVMSATRSWPELWAMLGHVDAVHGAYYLFMHGWVGLFGTSPVSLRVPSAIGVGVAAAGVVQLVRLFKPLGLAIVAGVLFAMLPRVFDLGAEARPYAITMAFAVWLLVVGQQAARANTAWRWAGYALLLLAGTVWFAYLPLLAGTQLVLLWWWYPRARRGVVAAALGAAVAVSPFLVIAFGQRGQLDWIANAGINAPLNVLVGAWFGWWTVALVCWTLMIGVVFVTLRRRAPEQLVWLAAATVAVPLVLLWLASLLLPVFSPRYLAMCLPSVAVLIALALGELFSWKRVVGVLAALLLVGSILPVLVSLRGPYAKHDSDWAELAAAVQASALPGDAVLFDESGEPWFRPRLAMRGYPESFANVTDLLGTGLTETDVWDTAVLTLEQADWLGKLGAVDRVWLVEHAGQAAEADRSVLESAGFTAGETQQIHSTQLTLFTRG